MSLSTLVLDTNSKAMQAYWKTRQNTASNVTEGNVFDNILIAILSARLSQEEWEAVLGIAGKRFNEYKASLSK